MTKFLTLLLRFFPRPLPLGRQEFYDWSDRIISQCGDFADAESMRFVLATNVLHLGQQTAYKSDEFFIRTLKKAAANQVSSQIFQEIKVKQAEQREKEAADARAAQQKLEETKEENSPENGLNNQ